jgi:hypothetical protein
MVRRTKTRPRRANGVVRAKPKLPPDGQLTFARQNLSSPICKNISVFFEGKSSAY